MSIDPTDESTRSDLRQLVERYVGLWNEPDPETRGKLIRDLWAPDGGQVLADPPQEVREAAERLSFRIPPMEVHGHDALEARVTTAYEMFIAAGEHVFRAHGDAVQLLGNVVTLGWRMESRATGETLGRGVDVLALDGAGRIRTDYQFIG